MPLLILLLFIGLPIAEIAVLIKVADIIELWPTIALIVLTAIIGVYLLRLQGLSSLARAQSSLNEGKLPVNSITDAVGLMLSGAFLLTPGLITDTLGFALLIPAVRHGIASYLFKRARQSANIRVDIFGDSPDKSGGQDPFDPFHRKNPGTPRKPGPVIEGEVIEPRRPSKTGKDKNGSPDDPRDKNSPWNR